VATSVELYGRDETNQGEAQRPYCRLCARMCDCAGSILDGSVLAEPHRRRACDPTTLVLDAPSKMIVQGDTVGPPTGGCGTPPCSVARRTNYQVTQFSNVSSGTVWMGETPTVSGWSCSGPDPGSEFKACSAQFQAQSGFFTDEWSLVAMHSPAGCGDNVHDVWQWCAPPIPFVPRPVGTLDGYVHTDAVNINGVVNPPNSFPPNTVILP
jgi:hypothetical protein